MLDFDHLGGHSFQNLSSRFFLIICDDSVVSLDILMLQKPETNNDGQNEITDQHNKARQEGRQVIRCRIDRRHMRRDFDKIEVNLNSQKSQNHLQNFRDIGNRKADNNACNCISGVDRCGKRKADVRHHKKNARNNGKSIVTRIRNGPHAKFAACKNAGNDAAHQHDQYICGRYRKNDGEIVRFLPNPPSSSHRSDRLPQPYLQSAA